MKLFHRNPPSIVLNQSLGYGTDRRLRMQIFLILFFFQIHEFSTNVISMEVNLEKVS